MLLVLGQTSRACLCRHFYPWVVIEHTRYYQWKGSHLIFIHVYSFVYFRVFHCLLKRHEVHLIICILMKVRWFMILALKDNYVLYSDVFYVNKSHWVQSKRHRLWFSTKTSSCYSTKTHVDSGILILNLNLNSLRNIKMCVVLNVDHF